MSQIERLRALLAELTPGNRFYTRRFEADGVEARAITSLEEFSRRVSFTHKQDLVVDQAAHAPYGTNHTYPLERYTRFCQTSGTTARPLVILDTPESWQWMLGNWAAIYQGGGLEPGDRIYFAFSFGPFLGFWTAFDAAAKCGYLGIPGGGLGSAARVRAMIQHQANVLCCTPTYALRLAQAAKEEDIDLRQAAVKKIIVAGETGGSVPEVRRRITEAWHGAQVLDHYGMTEVGPTAYQTPERADLLHIIEDSYFAEIIRPETGEAVTPGEVGELVLTTLGRAACPLLRYRTGDLVRRAEQEPGFALAGGIIGRADDMVVVRGVNLYPAAFDSAVRLVPEIDEYRVEISRRNTLTEVEVQIESPDDGAAKKLERALTSTFSLRIPVTRVAEHTLPRFEMKARRWVWRE
ncbi:Phenylacetate--CoA ligase [Chthoniobacter flavus Ellin428]|uniref:Phenylacetate--CoA ligase n=1 Tax=Chthoniobacter flavus Ellin428 TaxID=497964 RepID=B4D7N0_9BACT|nr:AMP-binding protein [Chthoniobacter flavus]EDY17647.1 Phenylacetate--CoA ligase [Chthoniobacter flavus Ellin428]TCO92323.1 phenylacetate-CoA ligase [Chthoniobacter flavus]